MTDHWSSTSSQARPGHATRQEGTDCCSRVPWAEPGYTPWTLTIGLSAMQSMCPGRWSQARRARGWQAGHAWRGGSDRVAVVWLARSGLVWLGGLSARNCSRSHGVGVMCEHIMGAGSAGALHAQRPRAGQGNAESYPPGQIHNVFKRLFVSTPSVFPQISETFEDSKRGGREGGEHFHRCGQLGSTPNALRCVDITRSVG